MSIRFSIPGLMDVPQVISAVDTSSFLQDAEVGTYHSQPIFQGDTWDGIPEMIIRINGAPPASALDSATVVFFKQNYTPGTTPDTGCLLTTENDSVIILSGDDWSMTVPPVTLPLNRGNWSFHIRTTDLSGSTKTRVVGTLSVL